MAEDDAGVLRGMVTREAQIAALQETGGNTPVIDFMQREIPTVPENACLDNVFDLLRRKDQRAVGVADRQQRLLGYITPEHLAELVMIQSSHSARAERAFASPRGPRAMPGA